MKASDYIVDYLVGRGINRAYGYIGGMIVHLVDSMDRFDDFSMVNTIHEQGAAFAAEGDARVTGNPAVALATSGPGATNLITGIGSCFFDSVPVLFLTGQVNTYEYKHDLPVRQRGFQETDVVGMVGPVTKYAAMVASADTLRFELEKALFLATHGRKGPVLLDLPMDVQRTDIDPDRQPSFFDSAEYHELTSEPPLPSADRLRGAVEMLNASKRPVILVGGGCVTDAARNELSQLLGSSAIPVVSSLMGLDAVGQDYPWHMGLIGSYGNRYGNLALANADLILVLGSRLDTRQTGTRPDSFGRGARLIRVEIDGRELEHSTVQAALEFHCDAAAFLKMLNAYQVTPDLALWHDLLTQYREAYPSTAGLDKAPKLPNLVMDVLSRHLTPDDVICVDVGQNQMWVAQSLRVRTGQRVLFSGGMGAMGFALPSAIGARIASGRRVIVIAGDGGIQMNIQELEVLQRRGLAVKVIVMNNACLGMVRQFQEIYFNGNCPGTVEDYSCPDLVAVARAYGIRAARVEQGGDVDASITELLIGDAPGLLDVRLETGTVVEPKLIVSKPLEDMAPALPREELKARMVISLEGEEGNG